MGWTLQAFAECAAVDDVLLIGSENDLPRLREIGQQFGGGKVRDVVLGGADRQASVRNGLAACPDAEYVVVHDGARPCVTPALIEETLLAAHRVGGGATAAVPIADTLVRESKPAVKHGNRLLGFSGPAINREGLWAIQTPQAFHSPRFKQAHQMAQLSCFHGTDDTSVYRLLENNDESVYLTLGFPENIKVTRPEDLTIVEAILARRQASSPNPLPAAGRGGLQNEGEPKNERPAEPTVQQAPPSRFGEGVGGRGLPTFRIGTGYDVHPFAPASDNRTLYIGGVSFPDHPQGLAGHSDADVLLHALCDALLGAAGLPDIGHLFPPSDNRHKNRASIEFLEEVAGRLREGGWQVANVDMTVIAEAPKINPRAGEMKAKIAVVLGIGLTEVGIKATTSEGLGFVGRGEGIAAHATALLVRP